MPRSGPVNGSSIRTMSGAVPLAAVPVLAAAMAVAGTATAGTAAAAPALGTLTQHWNGVKWRVVPSPSPDTGAAGDVFLFGVAAVSANDAWAVGTVQSGPDPFDLTTSALILHWNGEKWTQVPCPCGRSDHGEPVLAGISAVSRSDIWAVGSGSSAPLILHFNGKKWTTAPLAGDTEHQLTAVSATSANNAWAVGNDLDHLSGLTAHWNGTKWRWVTSPNPGGFNHLSGVAAQSSSSAWAVGDANGTPKIMHWTGKKWSTVPSPQLTGTDNAFFSAISAAPDGSLWAVGQEAVKNGTETVFQRLIARWTGKKWVVVPSPGLGKNSGMLSGVYVASAASAWAVEDGEDPGTPAGILHWNGSRWRLAQP